MIQAPPIDLAGPLARVARVARHRVVLTLADQGVVSVATFATGVMVSRASQSGFGMYALVLTLWVFAGEMQNSLVHTPHMLRLPRLDAARARRFNGSMLLCHLALASLVTLGFLAASAVLFVAERNVATEEDCYALVTLMTALSVLPIGLRNFARAVCFATRDGGGALAIDCGVAAIQLGGVALLAREGVLATHWWAAVAAIAGGNLLSAIVWLLASRDRFRAGIARARRDFAHTWRTGRMVFASSMIWAVGGQAYPWLISLIAGHAAAGVWGACVALACLTNPLLTAVQNVMGPAIAHAHSERSPASFRRYVLRCSLAFVAIVLPPCAAMALASNVLLVRLNGSAYAGYGTVSALVGLSLALQGISFPTSRGLFSLGRAGLDTLANLGPILVLLCAGAALIRTHGVYGAAVSLLIAQASSAVLHLAAFLAVSRHPAVDQPTLPMPATLRKAAA